MMTRINKKNNKGQTALVLILLTAAALIFYAITINWGQNAQVKTAVTMAADEGAAQLASGVASYGEMMKQGYLGDTNSVTSLTGILIAIAEVVTAVIVLIIAIIVDVVSEGTASYLVVLAVLALTAAIANLTIQVVVVQPMITSMWNKLMKNFPPQEYVLEQAISQSLQAATGDQANITDYLDWNGNGSFGVTQNPDGSYAPNDTVGRYAMFYNDRLKMLNQKDQINPQVAFFYTQLGQLMHGETCAQDMINSAANNNGFVNPANLSPTCKTLYTEGYDCSVAAADPVCSSVMAGGIALEDGATPNSDPTSATYSPYTDPCCQPPSNRPSSCVAAAISPTAANPECYTNNPYNSPNVGGVPQYDSVYPFLYDPTFQNYSTGTAFLSLFGHDQQLIPATVGTPPTANVTPPTAGNLPITNMSAYGSPANQIYFPNGIYPFFWLMKDYSVQVDDINSAALEPSQYHWCEKTVTPAYNTFGDTATAFPELAQLAVNNDPYGIDTSNSGYVCSGANCCVNHLDSSSVSSLQSVASSPVTITITTGLSVTMTEPSLNADGSMEQITVGKTQAQFAAAAVAPVGVTVTEIYFEAYTDALPTPQMIGVSCSQTKHTLTLQGDNTYACSPLPGILPDVFNNPNYVGGQNVYIIAVAKDSNTPPDTATSAPVPVQLYGPQDGTPVISTISATSTGNTIEITGTTTETGGIVSSVVCASSKSTSTTVIAEQATGIDSTNPWTSFTCTLSNMPAGSDSVYAIAYDAVNVTQSPKAYVSPPVEVTNTVPAMMLKISSANTQEASSKAALKDKDIPVIKMMVTAAVPVVAISNPATGSSYAAGTTVTLQADVSGSTGTVTFLAKNSDPSSSKFGETVLSQAVASPYTYNWNTSDLIPSTYTITASVSYNNGSATSGPQIIDVVGDLNLSGPSNPSYTINPALDSCFAMTGSSSTSCGVTTNNETWAEGDNQMCSTNPNFPYHGYFTYPTNPPTYNKADSSCQWFNASSETVSTSAPPTPVDPPSTMDQLDNIMHILSGFSLYANSLLNQNVLTLSQNLSSWYNQAFQEWLGDASISGQPAGQLSKIYSRGGVDLLNEWSTKVIGPWLNNSYAAGDAYCVPSSGSTGSASEDSYIYQGATALSGAADPTWGDLPHVISCLNYNSGGINFLRCLNQVNKPLGQCPAVLPPQCSPSILGPGDVTSFGPAPAYDGCQHIYQNWVQENINDGAVYNFNQCSASLQASSGYKACGPCAGLGRSLAGAPSASCGAGDGKTYADWASKSAQLAAQEAPKFAKRAAFLTDIYTRAKTMQKIFSSEEAALKDFFCFPGDATLSHSDPRYDPNCPAAGGPVYQLSQASPTNPSTQDQIPNSVIYGWSDLTADGSGTTGTHIVKVTAYSPGRSGNQYVGDQFNSGELSLPWIQTGTTWDTRSYNLIDRDGWVYVDVKRWDSSAMPSSSASFSSGGDIHFPNGNKLWRFLGGNPARGNASATGIPTQCTSSYGVTYEDGSTTPSIGYGLLLNTVQGMNLEHLGAMTADKTALANAFMLNDEGDGLIDNNACPSGGCQPCSSGSNNSQYCQCMFNADSLLSQGTESRACAYFIAVANNTSGRAAATRTTTMLASISNTYLAGNTPLSGQDYGSGAGDEDYSVYFMPCGSKMQGSMPQDDLSATSGST